MLQFGAFRSLLVADFGRFPVPGLPPEDWLADALGSIIVAVAWGNHRSVSEANVGRFPAPGLLPEDWVADALGLG